MIMLDEISFFVPAPEADKNVNAWQHAVCNEASQVSPETRAAWVRDEKSAFEVDATFAFAIPKTKNDSWWYEYNLRPLDSGLVKAIEEALRWVVLRDPVQIVTVTVRKIYSAIEAGEKPGVKIEVKRLPGRWPR
jgi:Holliday junction resolvase RusA-like endonuclease